MLMDQNTVLAERSTLGTAVGRQNVGDPIDTVTARDLGSSNNLYLVINVTTALNSGSTATLYFDLVSDSENPISTTGRTIHFSSPAKTIADATTMPAGFKIAYQLPPQLSVPYERFLGVQAIVGTAVLTAGAVTASIVKDPPADWTAYPEASS